MVGPHPCEISWIRDDPTNRDVDRLIYFPLPLVCEHFIYTFPFNDLFSKQDDFILTRALPATLSRRPCFNLPFCGSLLRHIHEETTIFHVTLIPAKQKVRFSLTGSDSRIDHHGKTNAERYVDYVIVTSQRSSGKGRNMDTQSARPRGL